LVVLIALNILVLVSETWVVDLLLYGVVSVDVVVVLVLCMEFIELDLIVFARGKGVEYKYLGCCLIWLILLVIQLHYLKHLLY
jgi:hypothetical protein